MKTHEVLERKWRLRTGILVAVISLPSTTGLAAFSRADVPTSAVMPHFTISPVLNYPNFSLPMYSLGTGTFMATGFPAGYGYAFFRGQSGGYAGLIRGPGLTANYSVYPPATLVQAGGPGTTPADIERAYASIPTRGREFGETKAFARRSPIGLGFGLSRMMKKSPFGSRLHPGMGIAPVQVGKKFGGAGGSAFPSPSAGVVSAVASGHSSHGPVDMKGAGLGDLVDSD